MDGNRTDVLSAERIRELSFYKPACVILLETVDSTNEYIKRSVPADAPEMTVVIAKTQTAGRGRFARKFHSPDGCGIYMSILLKPRYSACDAVLITAAAAVAVSDACEEICGKKTQIKWVNDVLADGKKLCGILCEGVFNKDGTGLDRVIVGIGINAYPPKGGFADEIKDVAGAVLDTVTPDMRNRLIAKTLDRFYEYYTQLEKRTFLEKYRQSSCVTGKDITVIRNGIKAHAKAIAIDDDCRLLAEYADGAREYLSSGEVSIRLAE